MNNNYIYVDMDEIKCSNKKKHIIGTSALAPCFGVVLYNLDKKIAIVSHSRSDNSDLFIELMIYAEENNLIGNNMKYIIIPGAYKTDNSKENINKLENQFKKVGIHPLECKIDFRANKISDNESYNEFLFDAEKGIFVTNNYLEIKNNTTQNDNLIILDENSENEVNISLYDFIDENYKNKQSFIVSNVDENEYKEMVKQLATGELHKRESLYNNDNLGYNNHRYLLAYNVNDNNILISNYENFNEIGLYIIDEKGIYFDKEEIQFQKSINKLNNLGVIKVYTTETYFDVINHYLLDKYKNNTKDNTKVIK